MPERCSLAITVERLDADCNGILWDTGIPDECFECLNHALDSPAADTEFFKPKIYPEEDEQTLETYVVLGICRRDSGQVRLGVQEHGIDDEGTNEGSLYSRTTVVFNCKKS